MRVAIFSSCSIARSPSGEKSCGALSPNACSRTPATRTMKNSSKLELNIARNFSRSRSGLEQFSASSRTLKLNSSQLSSRLRKHSGPNNGFSISDMVNFLFRFRLRLLRTAFNFFFRQDRSLCFTKQNPTYPQRKVY